FPGGGWANYQRDNPEGFARFLERDLPEGRLGTDQEVANVIAFVLSDRARWINGAMIPVDGAQGRPTARWFGED
ncbi:MAG: SDR family oxidoreductase, partial [Chloroflexi bacterium]|nr:SDR family oxidoreductase [Chloroflexota bacterium]